MRRPKRRSVCAPKLIGLGKQTPGVECHHVDIEAAVIDHVQDGLILDAEAGRKDDPAVDFVAQKREPPAGGRRRSVGPGSPRGSNAFAGLTEPGGSVLRLDASGDRIARTKPPPAIRPSSSSTMRR